MATPLLRMSGIEKTFPGVKALKGVELELAAGEVLALLGENGAGKSTLIKILGGAQRPSAGTIEIDGVVTLMESPTAAIEAGVGVIYQEFTLVPELSIRDNLFLGQERGMIIPARAERSRAKELLAQLGMAIDPDTPCYRLSVAEQQAVEIAKALNLNAKILVMDEPSAALSRTEVDHLYTIMEDLASRGIGIIYISHRLEEIEHACHRITVLRDGEYVGTAPVEGTSRGELIEMMVGRPLDQEFPVRERSIGEVRLEVKGLTRLPKVNDLTFEVRSGEVVGLTGLVGAGRTETARLLFGADQKEAGHILLDGKELRIRSPRDAIAAGICLLTEDRKGQGLILEQSVRENFGLPNLSRFSSCSVINRAKEDAAFAAYVKQIQIKIPHHEQLARNLSGGNQQKVVLAKWLEKDAEVLIFDEPTRGIDVGAKYEIYLLINELARRGKAIIVISSELPEVLGICDRVLVMHEGCLRGSFENDGSLTQEDIMNAAIGTDAA